MNYFPLKSMIFSYLVYTSHLLIFFQNITDNFRFYRNVGNNTSLTHYCVKKVAFLPVYPV